MLVSSDVHQSASVRTKWKYLSKVKVLKVTLISQLKVSFASESTFDFQQLYNIFNVYKLTSAIIFCLTTQANRRSCGKFRPSATQPRPGYRGIFVCDGRTEVTSLLPTARCTDHASPTTFTQTNANWNLIFPNKPLQLCPSNCIGLMFLLSMNIHIHYLFKIADFLLDDTWVCMFALAICTLNKT